MKKRQVVYKVLFFIRNKKYETYIMEYQYAAVTRRSATSETQKHKRMLIEDLNLFYCLYPFFFFYTHNFFYLFQLHNI